MIAIFYTSIQFFIMWVINLFFFFIIFLTVNYFIDLKTTTNKKQLNISYTGTVIGQKATIKILPFFKIFFEILFVSFHLKLKCQLL